MKDGLSAFDFRFAGAEDIELLVDTRIIVLRAANGLDRQTDMSQVRCASREYYQKALADGSHAAVLVTDGGRFIGSGGISYYRVMPTFHNPTGEKGYIMNMYTAPEYRRRGIAARTLSLLVEHAREKGVTAISLEATDAGRPFYLSCGFHEAENEMELGEDDLLRKAGIR